MSAFSKLITRHCSEIGWSVAELKSNSAQIIFKMDSGRKQVVYVINCESTIEFSVPSALAVDAEADLPHSLSTALLCQNSRYKLGAWCIEQIQGKLVYSVMHNVDIHLLDRNCFERIISVLTAECDQFEGALEKLASADRSTARDGTNEFLGQVLKKVAVNTFAVVIGTILGMPLSHGADLSGD
jgi:hypothetical protein